MCHRHPFLLTALALLAACTETTLEFGDPADDRPRDTDVDADTDADSDTDTDADTDTDTDSDTDADTDSDTDTDTDADTDTGTTTPGDYDCDNLPSFNLGDTTMSDARAYHGLSFDDDGNLIGWDSRNSIVKSRYDGTREILLPGMRAVEQIDRLPDGDFVLSDTQNSRLLRLTTAGGSETLASGSGYAYGVTVGPDGNVYIADGSVHKVDVATGAITTIVTLPPRLGTIHTLNFNLDSTVMYLGTIGTGNLYYVDLDADLNPVGEPQLYAANVGSGWHDGIGLDICGNLYVADYYTRGLYRVETDGTITSMVDTDATSYGHGVEFGSGIDGWRDDAIYQPQPYNGATVREVVIGLADGDTVRTWNGVAVPW